MDKEYALYWSLAQTAIRQKNWELRDYWNEQAEKVQRKNHPVRRVIGLLILALTVGWTISVYTAIVVALT